MLSLEIIIPLMIHDKTNIIKTFSPRERRCDKDISQMTAYVYQNENKEIFMSVSYQNKNPANICVNFVSEQKPGNICVNFVSE